MKRATILLAFLLSAVSANAQEASEWQWSSVDLPLVRSDGATTRLRIANATRSWDATGGTWISVFIGSPFWSWSEYASVPAGGIVDFGPNPPGTGDSALRLYYGCAGCDLRGVTWTLTITDSSGAESTVRSGARLVIINPEPLSFPSWGREKRVTIYGPSLHSPCYDSAGAQVYVLGRSDDAMHEYTRTFPLPDSVAYCKVWPVPQGDNLWYPWTLAWTSYRSANGGLVVGN